MTTITRDQMILKDNEVSIWSKDRRNMLYTTDKFYSGIGVIHLNREWFVRGEDVEELADKAGWEYSTFDQAASAFSTGFKAGYNAKKGEFTREEMELAFNKGLTSVLRSDTRDYTFNKFMNELPPISLPQSLTLNKDNEIVKIEW